MDLGAVLWLIAGRPWQGGSGVESLARGSRGRSVAPTSGYPEYDRPGRFAATRPDDDDDLRRCRERAEEQRRRYREQRDPTGDE